MNFLHLEVVVTLTNLPHALHTITPSHFNEPPSETFIPFIFDIVIAR